MSILAKAKINEPKLYFSSSKHKSEDYKISAVKYYLNNDVSLDDVCEINLESYISVMVKKVII